MTWGRASDRAPFHRKWIALSNDAFALGWRAIMWARSPEAHARPGFVTERELRALSGGVSRRRFVAAVEELRTAGAPAHEHGVLEPVEGGYEVHDFDDYGPPLAGQSPRAPSDTPRPKLDRSEAARLAGQASAAKRRLTHGTAQPPRTSPNVVPNVPERRSTEQGPNDRDQSVERLPDSPEPDPERTTIFVQDTEAERLERRHVRSDAISFGSWDRPELSEYPDGLFEHARDSGALKLIAEEVGVDAWDVEACALGFKLHWTSNHGRRPRWMSKLKAWILEQHGKGKLAGIGTPPGAAEHAERTGRSRDAIESPGVARERAPAPLARLIRPPARTAAEIEAELAKVPPKAAEGAG